ncbi:MAG TPA: cupin domain-containing protein [Propionibacteriaceae bacterium]|nr:cupin domain-containing protein [Propionibacteriaceae bacterium]
MLTQLIGIDPERFANDYWGRQALLSRAGELPGGFAELLDSEAIDELVSERGLRTPFLRVAKNGSTLAEKAFTGPGGVGATIADQVSDDKLVRLFADGSTLVLQALHRVWPPIIDFCQRLATELGHPVQANAYVTPPQNQGFSNHYDVHDVFVLQLEGAKRWVIHSPVLEAPLRDQPWNARKEQVQARAAERPLIEAVLEPGDCLYLPRGFLHAAKALGGVSTHLTIGVHSWTRFALADDMLRQALQTVARDPEIRRSLPLGVDFADPGPVSRDIELVRHSLIGALEAADPVEILGTLRRNVRGTQRAAPIGPLRQLRDANRITATDRIALRKHLAASLDQIGGRSTVRGRAGDFPLREEDVAPMKALLDSGSARADDLGLDLARRLVLAGLATVE